MKLLPAFVAAFLFVFSDASAETLKTYTPQEMEILDWSTRAAFDISTHGDLSEQERTNRLRKYFTEDGWKEYVDYITSPLGESHIRAISAGTLLTSGVAFQEQERSATQHQWSVVLSYALHSVNPLRPGGGLATGYMTVGRSEGKNGTDNLAIAHWEFRPVD